MDRAGDVLLVGGGRLILSVSEVLDGAGFVTSTVSANGMEEALVQPRWDLVVMAGSAGGVDAAALCRRVRDHEVMASVPLVVLTSAAHGDRPAVVLGAGADDYVAVPHDAVELVTRIRTVLRVRGEDGVETRLRALVANLPGAVYRCDPGSQWTMDYISDQVAALCGYPPSDLIGDARRSFASVIHPDDREATESIVYDAIARDEPFVATYRVVCADSAVRWIRDRGRLVADGRGRRWIEGMLFDVTAQYEAEQQLLSRNAELVELREKEARHAVEAERFRIARELHDVVAHHVSAMTVSARAGGHVASRDPQAAADALAYIADAGTETLTAMGAFVGTLRGHEATADGGRLSLVPDLDDISDLLESFRGTGLVVHAALEPAPAGVPPALGLNAYRIVEEALTNAIRHGEAERVWVRISFSADVLHVVVDDNGRGLRADGRPAGHGLIGVAERAALHDGTSALGPSARGGCRLEATLSLHDRVRPDVEAVDAAAVGP